MILQDLRVPADGHVVLHGSSEIGALWTDLRLAQPNTFKTRQAVTSISECFTRLVITFFHTNFPGITLLPLVVMRGGVVFLAPLWKEVPGLQIGVVFPVRPDEGRLLELAYAQIPSLLDANLVVFDLIGNSGDTIEFVLEQISNSTSRGLPKPCGIHVAIPFTTVEVADRLKAHPVAVTLHTMWNGLRRRANGWLTGLDFDAGDLAFGTMPSVKFASGKLFNEMKPHHSLNSFSKVAALVRDGDRILVVRKIKSDRAEFIMPGGKPFLGESQEETLHREMEEELEIKVTGMKWFGWFEDIATFEGLPMEMDVYEVEIQGNPKPSSEIAEFKWISQNPMQGGTEVGNLLRNGVLPALQRLTRRQA